MPTNTIIPNLGVGTHTVPPPPATGTSSCANLHGVVQQYLCDPSTTFNGVMAGVSYALSQLMTAIGPWLPHVAAATLLFGALLALMRGKARQKVISSARWLDIVAPPQLNHGDTLALLRALAMRCDRNRHTRRSRMSLEFHATGDGVRVGIWVPDSMPHADLAEKVRTHWSGAKVTTGTGPQWIGGSVRAVEVRPRGGVWAPLLEGSPQPTRPAADTPDSLRAVLTALAATTPGQYASVQVVIAAHRDPTGHNRPWITRTLRRAVLNVLDVIQRTPRTPTGPVVRSVGLGPEAEAAQRAQDAKRGAGLHLRVTLRVITAGPNRRNRADGIAEGFAGVMTATSPRVDRVRRTGQRLSIRHHGQGFMATVHEVAALWHLPADTARYGIDSAPASNRPAGRGQPRIGRVVPTRVDKPVDSDTDPYGVPYDGRDDDDDEEGWNAYAA